MAEYIERELAIEALSRGEGCGNVCRRAIERILVADVAPVRHGRWEFEVGMNFYKERNCPVCKKRIESNFWSYCPNCGAKMDESTD